MRKILSLLALAAPAWAVWPNGYTYKDKIVIPAQSTTTTVTRVIPIYLSGTIYKLAPAGHMQSSSCYDLIFTSDSAGSSLLNWSNPNTDGTCDAAGGNILTWLQLTIPPSGLTVYVWKGNNTVATFQSPSSPYSAHTKMWLHLPNGTTLSNADSTGNTTWTTLSGATATTGVVAGGMRAWGHGISAANSTAIQLTSTWSFGMWLNSSNASIYMLGVQGGGPSWNGYNWELNGSGIPCFAPNSSAFKCAATAVNDGSWHLVGMSYSGKAVTFYRDGTADGTQTFTQDPVACGAAACGGVAPSGFINGVDEVFAQDTAMTADEWKIDFAAQRAGGAPSPTTNAFYSLAGEATNPGPTLTAIAPSAAYRGQSQNITLTGTAFGTPTLNAVISSSPWSGVSFTNVVVASPTSITATVVVTSGAAVGSGFIYVTDDGGQNSQEIAFTVQAPLFITAGPTLSGHSESSVWMTWATSAPADSQILCSLSTGGPYTIAATPVVDAVKVGTSSYYGVTSHALAGTGLSPSTTYYCVGKSHSQVIGEAAAQTAEVSATTTGPLTQKSLALAHVSAPTRYNDQYTCANGICSNPGTASGRWFSGDTKYCAWGSDGQLYCICNDCGGVNGGFGANAPGPAWIKYDATTNLNATESWAYLSGLLPINSSPYRPSNGYGSETIFSVRGNVYFGMVSRVTGTPGWTCGNLLKSTDHLATTVSPSANAGPYATTVQGTGLPNDCLFATDTVALWWPVNQCQDQSTNCTWTAGTDGWFYALGDNGATSTTSPYVLMRVRLEDLPLLDGTKVQFYKGSWTGNDGLSDSNWTTDHSQATVRQDTTYGRKPRITFLPGFNHYVMTTWGWCAADHDRGANAMIWDLGAYPWGTPTFLGAVPDLRSTQWGPAFPELIMPTWTVQSTSPYTATVRLSTTGNYGSTSGGDPTTGYAPVYVDLTFSEFSGNAPLPPLISHDRGYPVGPDLLYDFGGQSGQSWSTAIRDLAGKYSMTAGFSPVYDSVGLLAGCTVSGYQTPTAETLTTPYTAANTSWTVAAVWSHKWLDQTATGASGKVAPVNGETPLYKGGDVTISRSSTTTTWNIGVKGSTIAALTIPEGQYAAVIITCSGGNVAVYSSIEGGAPATATGAISSCAWGANPLLLLSGTAGGNPLAGTMGPVAVYSRRLTGDSKSGEVAQLLNAVKSQMAQRGVTLP